MISKDKLWQSVSGDLKIPFSFFDQEKVMFHSKLNLEWEKKFKECYWEEKRKDPSYKPQSMCYCDCIAQMEEYDKTRIFDARIIEALPSEINDDYITFAYGEEYDDDMLEEFRLRGI